MKEIFIWISIGCIMLFCVFISIMFSNKKSNTIELENIINGQPVVTKKGVKRQLQESVNNSSFYQKRVAILNTKIQKTYNDSLTAEYILKFQIMSFVGGLGILLLSQLIFNILIINIIIIGVTIYLVLAYDLSLTSKIKQKNNQFDNCLPLFEQNMLLGLQSNASLPNAMELAIQTLPESLVKVEFQKLLLDIKVNTDNVATAFINLSERIKTKDAERFCNIVISGLKNGNSMSSILFNESDYMQKQMINKIREQNKKNMTKVTIITSSCVFLPLLVVFLAPMMMTM